MQVVIINGSYRKDGLSDQITKVITRLLDSKKINYHTVYLRDKELLFCTNCRNCAQELGVRPGKCVLSDGFNGLVDILENADAYVLTSPTNFGTLTAIFKQFMERLIVYGYYPWGAKGPKYRKESLNKKSLIITSSAAPSFVSFLFDTKKLMKKCSRLLGARVEGTLCIGEASLVQNYKLNNKQIQKIEELGKKLLG